MSNMRKPQGKTLSPIAERGEGFDFIGELESSAPDGVIFELTDAQIKKLAIKLEPNITGGWLENRKNRYSVQMQVNGEMYQALQNQLQQTNIKSDARHISNSPDQKRVLKLKAKLEEARAGKYHKILQFIKIVENIKQKKTGISK